MAITSDMAKKTIRSTFALDPEAVAALDRLSAKWGMSKSETVRRLIEAAARVEEVDASSKALAALDDLQDALALTQEQADAWVRQIREMREDRGP